MNKLLNAGFSRLKKDKIFWIVTVSMLVCSIVYMLNGCRQAALDTMSEYQYGLDHYYFSYSPFIGLFCSVITSMFLGTEYSDGTIRNKHIAGHTRKDIYLSSLILSFTISLALLCTWWLGALSGVPFLGFWRMGSGVLIYLLVSILYLAAFSAIFTAISMLVSHKAMAQMVSVLLFLGLLSFAGKFYGALQQPEFESGILITSEGMSMSDPVPNPAYVTGTMREIYQFLVDFLPTGQCLLMYELKIVHPLRMILSSLFITGAVSFSGLWFFQKKNLK